MRADCLGSSHPDPMSSVIACSERHTYNRKRGHNHAK
jgi:hypothetical protein